MPSVKKTIPKKLIKPNNSEKSAFRKLTFSQRSSDWLTLKMGSWGFIILFFLYIVVWMLLNLYVFWQGWDPYPFILLNLTLSCLAAVQAPIILMSQNRAAERGHIRSEYDYAVNRKAEREIQNMQKDLEKIKQMLREMKK
jgi:uncharacterized membrane protein